jgi:hypothetical protein
MQIGDYNTATNGWTLSSWTLAMPKKKTNLVEVPASDVVLDLSTALTEGVPHYSTRNLTVTLECSNGDRLERRQRIADMINQLDGQKVNIILPDDPNHYLVGWVTVQQLYNDPAHASVQVDAVCEPWLYSDTETSATLLAVAEEKGASVVNSGRMAVVPSVEVTDGDVLVRFLTNGATWALSPGVYYLPDLYLTPGTHRVRYSGAGQIVIKYREAVLA